MKGKYYVTLAILCAFSNIFAQDPRVKAIKGILLDFCKEETGATTFDIEEFKGMYHASTEKGKCFRFCYYSKIGFLDKNGKLNMQIIQTIVEYRSGGDQNKLALAKKIIDYCSKIDTFDDKCESAVQYENCFRAELMLHNIELGYYF